MDTDAPSFDERIVRRGWLLLLCHVGRTVIHGYQSVTDRTVASRYRYFDVNLCQARIQTSLQPAAFGDGNPTASTGGDDDGDDQRHQPQRHHQGTKFDDIINGLDGNDELRGEEGNDALYGGRGLDALYGGIGDDILDGGHMLTRWPAVVGTTRTTSRMQAMW